MQHERPCQMLRINALWPGDAFYLCRCCRRRFRTWVLRRRSSLPITSNNHVLLLLLCCVCPACSEHVSIFQLVRVSCILGVPLAEPPLPSPPPRLPIPHASMTAQAAAESNTGQCACTHTPDSQSVLWLYSFFVLNDLLSPFLSHYFYHWIQHSASSASWIRWGRVPDQRNQTRWLRLRILFSSSARGKKRNHLGRFPRNSTKKKWFLIHGTN